MATRCMLMGVRPEWGSVKAQNEVMKDIFARSPEKTAVQVCVITVYFVVVSFKYLHVVPLSLCQGNQYTILVAVFFRRLKIDHDVHEFILDSGTVANRNFECQVTRGLELLRLSSSRRTASSN